MPRDGLCWSRALEEVTRCVETTGNLNLTGWAFTSRTHPITPRLAVNLWQITKMYIQTPKNVLQEHYLSFVAPFLTWPMLNNSCINIQFCCSGQNWIGLGRMGWAHELGLRGLCPWHCSGRSLGWAGLFTHRCHVDTVWHRTATVTVATCYAATVVRDFNWITVECHKGTCSSRKTVSP